MRPTPSRSFTARSCARRSNAVSAPKRSSLTETNLVQSSTQANLSVETKLAPQVQTRLQKAAVAA